MGTPATPEMNERYRKGLCVDCGENPYRFGRPRCPKCHDTWWEATTTYKEGA